MLRGIVAYRKQEADSKTHPDTKSKHMSTMTTWIKNTLLGAIDKDDSVLSAKRKESFHDVVPSDDECTIKVSNKV